MRARPSGRTVGAYRVAPSAAEEAKPKSLQQWSLGPFPYATPVGEPWKVGSGRDAVAEIAARAFVAGKLRGIYRGNKALVFLATKNELYAFRVIQDRHDVDVHRIGKERFVGEAHLNPLIRSYEQKEGLTLHEGAHFLPRVKGRSAGRSSGSMHSIAAAAHCSLIPVEGFLISESPHDIPPMTSCTVRPSEPGFIRGRRRARGRAAGAKKTVTAHSRDDRARLFSAVFGHAVTGADLEVAFSGVSRGGTKAVARLMRVYTSGASDPDYLDVSADFEVRIGSHSGVIIRRFYREKKTGKVIAYHEKFDLDESTPKELGQGVGESITRRAILWYLKNGVSEIRTYAAWVGRYVWATFGFNWADGEVQHDKARELAGYLEDHEDAFDPTKGATIRGQFKVPGSPTSAIRTVSQGVSKDAWTLASLHLPAARASSGDSEMVHVGKTFLIGIKDPRDPRHYLRGEEGASDWEGILVLKPGHPSFERARVRLKL